MIGKCTRVTLAAFILIASQGALALEAMLGHNLAVNAVNISANAGFLSPVQLLDKGARLHLKLELNSNLRAPQLVDVPLLKDSPATLHLCVRADYWEQTFHYFVQTTQVATRVASQAWQSAAVNNRGATLPNWQNPRLLKPECGVAGNLALEIDAAMRNEVRIPDMVTLVIAPE